MNNSNDPIQVADDGNRADVEDEAAKPEPESDATPVVSGHIRSSSVTSCLDTSRGCEQFKCNEAGC